MALLHVMSAIRARRSWLSVADWLIAAASVVVAIWTRDPWWIAGAVLAVVLALASPTARMIEHWPRVIRRVPPKGRG